MVEVSGDTLAAGASPVGPPPARPRFPLLAQAARYLVVGGLSTALNAVIFYVMRTWWDPLPANLLALVLSTVASTEANRRFTFPGARVRRWRVHAQSATTVGFYACYSSVVLLLLHAVVAEPTRLQETWSIALASVLLGTCRFLLLRHWVFTVR